MRGMEFLEKLEHIDPAWLAEAEQTPTRKRRRLPRWGVALAACLALLVGTCAGLAVHGSGVHVLGILNTWTMDDHTPRPLYAIGVEAVQFPMSSFTGEVLGAGTEFIAQYEQWQEEISEELRQELAELLEEDPEQHVFTGTYRRDFDTAQEAWDYIGLAALKNPDMGMEEEKAWSVNMGNPLGQIQSISFCVVYTHEELRIMTSALIFTEYEDVSEDGVILFTPTERNNDKFFTTAAERQCCISYPEPTEEGRYWMIGEMVVDGILYNITVSHLPEDADRAMELLHHWADQF